MSSNCFGEESWARAAVAANGRNPMLTKIGASLVRTPWFMPSVPRPVSAVSPGLSGLTESLANLGLQNAQIVPHPFVTFDRYPIFSCQSPQASLCSKHLHSLVIFATEVETAQHNFPTQCGSHWNHQPFENSHHAGFFSHHRRILNRVTCSILFGQNDREQRDIPLPKRQCPYAQDRQHLQHGEREQFAGRDEPEYRGELHSAHHHEGLHDLQ